METKTLDHKVLKANIEYVLERYPDITVIRITIDSSVRVSYQCVTPDKEINIQSAENYKSSLEAAAQSFLDGEHPGWKSLYSKCLLACYKHDGEIVCELLLSTNNIQSFKYVSTNE